jgi:stage V sporulation protein R
MGRYINELEGGIERIWEIAQSFGLRPFPTHFEVVPATVMYELGSYGMPGRFSHWTHGKAYQMQKTMYDYGLSKIYELVINTDPCYAFLLETNTVLQNKLVAAHVLGHSDFFANNAYFSRTSRKMVDTISLNAERIRRYEFEHGFDEVERVLDAALSIDEHVDPYVTVEDVKPDERKPEERRSSQFDDLWHLDRPGEPEEEPDLPRSRARPREPVRDLLLFIIEHSPRLDDWERDIVSIVRTEMLYFLPQMRTKILNEGWASYWHARIMRELDLDEAEYLEFAQLHAAILQPSSRRINPYHLGFRILEDIERRANEDGKDGREQLFQVREIENDVSLIRNYLTEELVEDLDLYLYKRVGDELVIVDKDW